MINEPIRGLDSIVRALEIWVDITGVDPNTKSWATTNEWEIRHINEELKESLKQDFQCTINLRRIRCIDRLSSEKSRNY